MRKLYLYLSYDKAGYPLYKRIASFIFYKDRHKELTKLKANKLT